MLHLVPLLPHAVGPLSLFSLARSCVSPSLTATLQLAERAELFWDDGTAEPEWFVDRGSAGGAMGGRPWHQSTGMAAAQLGGVFAFIFVFVYGPACLMGDSLATAAPRWSHGFPGEPEERLAQQGIDGFQGSAVGTGLNVQTKAAAGEAEEDEE